MNPATGSGSAIRQPPTLGRKSATPSEPEAQGGESEWSPEWTPEDAAFHERLADITGAVGRGFAVGIPALFLIGLFLAPFRGVIPSAVVLTIIVVGAIGLVVLVERLRGSRRRTGRGGPLIGRRGLVIFGIGLAAWLILVSAIAFRA